jgi:hypothetical protein
MSERPRVRILPCLFMFIAMAASAPVSAADDSGMACQSSVRQVDPAKRESELLVFDREPEACLKAMFMNCSEASEQNVLDVGTAMVCSVAYEALLKSVFKGNFDTLLAWWQSQRGKPGETPAVNGMASTALTAPAASGPGIGSQPSFSTE